MVCVCPTMPKRGAVTSTTRRSRSSLWPVISPCTGAAKPSAATSPGTSCTRPSVMKMAPATRSWGTSESAEDSAVNNRVPSVSPSAWPASTKRTSMPAMRPSRSASAARTASVCCKRSPNSWLGLLSMTTAATEVSGSRSSRVIDGLASASTNSASARTTSSSLSQPFEQRRNVDLVGLVVAGERVHHDVDAGAEREFALARLGGDERQHGLAVLAHRPGAGEIVRRDDDRRHAVAGARRTAHRLVLVDGRQRFHPQLAGAEAARKVLQEIERLRQHVVAPHRLERGIEPDGLARLERGTLGEEQGEALEPGLADAVDLDVAGDDVGKPRLERRSQGLLIAALRERARRGRQRRGEDGERERSRHRPLP